MNQLWGEYIPNWIAAVSTLLAFVAAGVAAYLAWRSIRGERERDARHDASGLSSWWVTGTMGGKEVWGVVITNTSQGVFREVTIAAVGNSHPKARDTIHLRVVPPGYYFVESMSKSSSVAWGAKAAVSDLTSFIPLINAESRRVRSIWFTDTSGSQWEWSPDGGLKRQKTSEGPR